MHCALTALTGQWVLEEVNPLKCAWRHLVVKEPQGGRSFLPSFKTIPCTRTCQCSRTQTASATRCARNPLRCRGPRQQSTAVQRSQSIIRRIRTVKFSSRACLHVFLCFLAACLPNERSLSVAPRHMFVNSLPLGAIVAFLEYFQQKN